MPTLEVKTVKAEQVWKSPDGQRKIYQLELDYQGKPVKAQTFSEAIATPGWVGTVETYERGNNTFVKQPPKEGASSGTYGGSGGRSSIGRADPFTMYLSYAKDIAVALIGVKAYTVERLAEIVNDVSLAGEQLYEARPEAKAADAESRRPMKPEPDTVHEVTDKAVDLNMVDKVFNADAETTQELPWPEKT